MLQAVRLWSSNEVLPVQMKLIGVLRIFTVTVFRTHIGWHNVKLFYSLELTKIIVYHMEVRVTKIQVSNLIRYSQYVYSHDNYYSNIRTSRRYILRTSGITSRM